MCIRCGLGVLPFLLAVLSAITFVITYIISRVRNDTSWFPTISDTASRRPESNVFGLLFNFCSLLALFTTFVRYLQLRHDADWNERDRALLIRLNKLAAMLGVAASLGGSIVANFQVIFSKINGYQHNFKADVRCRKIIFLKITTVYLTRLLDQGIKI